MYERITDENGYKVPMRIYPAPHYAMGGLWVDYNLMSNLPGLFVLGEANFSVHGANRLGASALMQGLADGYFVIPYTIANYLVQTKPGKVKADHAECRKSIDEVKGTAKKFLSIQGNRTVTEFMRELGTLMWNNCGMARSKESLSEAIAKIPAIREEFWKNVKVSGIGAEFNQQLENAGRTADFMEFAELLCRDALHRNESCGGHFRVEYQYEDGEAKRDDANYAYAAAWGFKGVDREPELHKEPLTFENIHLAVRSYK
jgi:succinate dehydrogenase / fumarate reductase flavoprotein subunit